MLEKEFKYYLQNQEELVDKFYGRFILIKDEKVLGNFSTEVEAILFAQNTLGLQLGSFLVQNCLPGVENYMQYFHSNFIFT